MRSNNDQIGAPFFGFVKDYNAWRARYHGSIDRNRFVEPRLQCLYGGVDSRLSLTAERGVHVVKIG
jgi:hypothetical protein